MTIFEFIKAHKNSMSTVYKNSITPTVINSYMEVYIYYIDTVQLTDSVMEAYNNTSIEFGLSVGAVRKVVKKMSDIVI